MDKNFITVNNKRFHYIWLRDNCLSSKCQDANSLQRIYDFTECISPPEPLLVEQDEEELRIIWKEEPPHHSKFPISWLMNRAYNPTPKPNSESEFILWDKAWLDVNPPEQHDIYSSPPLRWMNELSKLGFTRLSNISVENLEDFLSSIGPILETDYEKISDIKPTVEGKDIGISINAPALSPHTDQSYKNVKNLVEFFYCVEHNAKGGDSIIVDGFYVAECFRKNHPKYFQVLTETPVLFQQFDSQRQYFFSHKFTIIALDGKGNISRICFSHKNCVRDLPFEQVEDFYAAYSAFMSYLKNPAYQYQFRYKPGDCLLLNNARILHGRTAFETNSGTRHLKAGFIDWDHFVARKAFNQKINSVKH